MRRVLVIGVMLALLSPAYGQMGPGYGMGPEMMGGWGNWTMGPGMMGNWTGEQGYGMMNPQMMGLMAQMMHSGMMGGYGMGPEMMEYRDGYGPGMMGYYHGGYKGTADLAIHYLFWILLLAIMATVLYLLLAKKVCHMGGRAMETVRDRYARGEINEEEYRKMKATLGER